MTAKALLFCANDNGRWQAVDRYRITNPMQVRMPLTVSDRPASIFEIRTYCREQFRSGPTPRERSSNQSQSKNAPVAVSKPTTNKKNPAIIAEIPPIAERMSHRGPKHECHVQRWHFQRTKGGDSAITPVLVLPMELPNGLWGGQAKVKETKTRIAGVTKFSGAAGSPLSPVLREEGPSAPIRPRESGCTPNRRIASRQLFLCICRVDNVRSRCRRTRPTITTE